MYFMLMDEPTGEGQCRRSQPPWDPVNRDDWCGEYACVVVDVATGYARTQTFDQRVKILGNEKPRL